MLDKSIHDLRKSGPEWNSELDGILHNLGFCKLKRCNYMYKVKSDAVLDVHIDDLILCIAIYLKNIFVNKRI